MRRAVLFLSVCLLTIGLTDLLFPSFLVNLFALDRGIALTGAAVGFLGIANGMPPLQHVNLRVVFRALGLALIGAALYTVNSPTYGGLRATYVPVTDIFIMLESGITALLLSTEVYEEALPPFAYASVVLQLLYNRFSGRLTPPAPTPTLRRQKNAH